MSLIKKTSTELDWQFVGSEPLLTAGLIALKFQLTNPYFYAASIGEAKWKSPSTGEYLPITLALSQIENPNSIPSRSTSRIATIYWDAAADLRIMQAFPAVTLAFSFWDRPNQAGTKTAIQEFTVPVDFTLSALGRAVKMVRPVVHDPYFKFDFISPRLIRSGRLHFILEVDSDESFSTGNYLKYDSSADQANWTCDGVPLTGDGVDGTTTHRVGLIVSEIENLSLGDWFYRITPIVSQFQAEITSPVNGQVFLDTTIEVNGHVNYWDNP